MRLSEGLIVSEIDLDQQMQLTKEEEHQNDTLMIGGIKLFLPSAQEEAENSVVDDATAEQSQLMMTVKEEMEQTLKPAQAEMKEESEHPVEWLNALSIEAEETATWEFAAEAKEEDEHSEECLSIFSHEIERVVALKLAAEEAREQAGKVITPWEMELCWRIG
jgi:hypothetical protein